MKGVLRGQFPFSRLMSPLVLLTLFLMASFLYSTPFSFTTDITQNATYSALTTVDLPEKPAKTTILSNFLTKKSTTKTTNSAKSTKITTASSIQKTTTKTAKTTAKSDSITIGGRTISIFTVNNTTVDAGSQVARYKSTGFLYGHNSSSVFGNLKNLSTGTNFSVTLSNQTTTYKIAKIVTLKKSDVAKNMNNLALNQTYGGVKYDLVLMTCAGQKVGSADATHRLIILANTK